MTTKNHTHPDILHNISSKPCSGHTHEAPHSDSTCHGHNHTHASFDKMWLPTVLMIVLFAASYGINMVSKSMGLMAFTLTTGIGLVPVFKKIIQHLKSGYIFSIELLMSVSSVGAILIHAAAEAAAVIILFMIGGTLEKFTEDKAKLSMLSLASLIPQEATLVLEKGATKKIKAQDVQINQLLETKPGERFAADGVIVQGTTWADESLLSGESTPIFKSLGDPVVAGSISTDGHVVVRSTCTGKNNTVTRVAKLVQNAQASQSKIMRSIEKFSQYYTPFVLFFSICITFIPPLLNLGTWEQWIYRGLTLLLIGCPCALVISTPSAIAAGITVASRFGVLIKNASAIEMIGRVKTIAFDKTGTLTYGEFRVTDVIPFSTYHPHEVLAYAASIEEKSNHPIGKSIVKQAHFQNIPFEATEDAKTIAGKGASAFIGGKFFLVCSVSFARQYDVFSEEAEKVLTELQAQGKTICTVLIENKLEGFIALQDTLKEDTLYSLEALEKLGIKTVVLTGDSLLSAKGVLGNTSVEIRADATPEQKLSYIKSDLHGGQIAMVGDGINDAPSLVAATVGIAVGGGTDVAMDCAQIIIPKNNIFTVVQTVQLSRKILNYIGQNVAIAVGLKLVFLVLTLTGDTKLWIAILADTGATVLVTLNAMRLLSGGGTLFTKKIGHSGASSSGT